MRIAICDKDNIFSYKLKHILYAYSNTYKLEFYIDTFQSGEELLTSQSKYLLIFIDYSLLGINGLETAKQLRRQDNNCKIIFLSQNTEFIFETFKVNTYRFLTKPLCENLLYKALNELFLNNNTHYPLLISEGNNTFCIQTEEIVYLEANNKYCYVHLKDRVILCKKTMAQVFSALPKPHFQKINRAFIVNLGCINKYNPDDVFLKNGEQLRITRTYYKIFKQKYIEYSCPKIL